MPYDEAYEYMKKYSEDRAKQLQEGKRLKWSTADVATFEALEKKFDTAAENKEWKGLVSADKPDWDKLIGILGKIGWMCGHRRDLRKLFLAAGSVQRTPVDNIRFEALRLLWYKKGLQRTDELFKQHKGVE